MTNHGGEPPPLRDDGLQLNDDRRFQERFWSFERGAWAAYALLVLLALSGLTGAGGPLAQATTASAAGEVEHPRVTRAGRADHLTVRFSGAGSVRRLALSEPFSELFDVETIRPEPARSRMGAEGLVYEFDADDDPVAPVRLTLRAEGPGVARFRIVVDDAEPLDVTTLILP